MVKPIPKSKKLPPQTAVNATSLNIKREEEPDCELAECVFALAAAVPAISACADAVADQKGKDSSTNSAKSIGEDIDCLVEAVESAVDIPKDCAPCVQALFSMGTEA